eukprot:6197822-Pleurochrysis_carterae.AAC.4
MSMTVYTILRCNESNGGVRLHQLAVVRVPEIDQSIADRRMFSVEATGVFAPPRVFGMSLDITTSFFWRCDRHTSTHWALHKLACSAGGPRLA